MIATSRDDMARPHTGFDAGQTGVQMGPSGTDAVGMLRWGLRRHRWLFLVCVLVGAVLAPVLTLLTPAPSQSEALVVAQRLEMDLVALPRYGEAVFGNGEVARSVAARFGALGDVEDVIPNRVSLITEQDSIVLRVVGHDVDPRAAADIANVAAVAFVRALNAPGVGVGAFEVQSSAQPASEPANSLRTVFAIPVGFAAGLILGVAVVSGLLVARRPVIDPADVEATSGVPSLGMITVPRSGRGTFPPADAFAGVVPACRRLLAIDMPAVVLVSPRAGDRHRPQVAVALATVLGRVRSVSFDGPADSRAVVSSRLEGLLGDGPAERNGQRQPGLTVIDSVDSSTITHPPQVTTTVLVVPVGIAAAALRAAAVENLGGTAQARVLLVMPGRQYRPAAASEGEHVGVGRTVEHDAALAGES